MRLEQLEKAIRMFIADLLKEENVVINFKSEYGINLNHYDIEISASEFYDTESQYKENKK